MPAGCVDDGTDDALYGAPFVADDDGDRRRVLGDLADPLAGFGADPFPGAFWVSWGE